MNKIIVRQIVLVTIKLLLDFVFIATAMFAIVLNSYMDTCPLGIISFLLGISSVVLNPYFSAKWGLRKTGAIITVIMSCISLAFGCYAMMMEFGILNQHKDSRLELRPESVDEYRPFSSISECYKLEVEPTLHIEENLPVISTNTYLYKIAASTIENVYPSNTNVETCIKIYNTQTETIDELRNGKVDIVVTNYKSLEDLNNAKSKNSDLEFTVICKDAITFYVSSRNPVKSIYTSQIGNIYNHRIKNFVTLDGGLRTIHPSISGNDMKQNLEDLLNIQIVKNLESQREITNNTMGCVYNSSLCEKQQGNMKIISVNNTYPTYENIKNNQYPLTETIVIISRKQTNLPETDNLIKWISSNQGQYMLYKLGYTQLLSN